MTITSLGTDGYLKIQKEVTYGTKVVDSQTDIPYQEGTNASLSIAQIERKNVYNARIKQAPSKGRKMASMEIVTEMHPALMGLWTNLLLGTSTNSGTGAVTHKWAIPKSGSTVGKSFTAELAVGADNPDILTGCVPLSFSIESDSEGNIKQTIKIGAKDYERGSSRASSFSFPSQIPFNFSHSTLTITPSGGSAISQPVNSFTLEYDLNYNAERFKAGVASNTVSQPIFNGIPTVSFKCSIDADKQFLTWANDDQKVFSIQLELQTTDIASGSTAYKTQFNLPGCILKASKIDPKMENIEMELEFDGGYGGSYGGFSNVMGVVTVIDAVSTYA